MEEEMRRDLKNNPSTYNGLKLGYQKTESTKKWEAEQLEMVKCHAKKKEPVM